MTTLHRIVIVGGGAGGLELVTQLGHQLGKTKKAQITLVDQNLTHIWKPSLHEIAAGSLNLHEEETNYFAHAAKHHYKFILGQFTALDSENKTISIKSTHQSKFKGESVDQIHYDTLVIAIGSNSNDFKTPGVSEHCYFIDTPKQAENFHQDLLNLYLDAQHNTTPRALKIAIVGAGATGVELAAELMQAKTELFKYGLQQIDPQQVEISIIEASKRILPALSEKTAQQTTQQLEKQGIRILTQHRVSEVTEESIYFTDGSSLSADLKVWAAGIKAPDVLQKLENFEKDHLNRLKVYATLQTLTDPDVFAFGDCAFCQPVADEPPLAPRAQVASQQASFLVKTLKKKIQNKPLPMFKFSDKGSLISLSHAQAVGELAANVHVQGAVAKSMYVSLYHLHQANIHGYVHAGILFSKGFLTKKYGPKIKLH